MVTFTNAIGDWIGSSGDYSGRDCAQVSASSPSIWRILLYGLICFGRKRIISSVTELSCSNPSLLNLLFNHKLRLSSGSFTKPRASYRVLFHLLGPRCYRDLDAIRIRILTSLDSIHQFGRLYAWNLLYFFWFECVHIQTPERVRSPSLCSKKSLIWTKIK